jgi:hypothetical protein
MSLKQLLSSFIKLEFLFQLVNNSRQALLDSFLLAVFPYGGDIMVKSLIMLIADLTKVAWKETQMTEGSAV